MSHAVARKVIDWPAAQAAAAAAVNAAAAMGVRVNVALVDAGGGLPIVEDGQCIGAIGASGGSEQQDEQFARAGLAALGLD